MNYGLKFSIHSFTRGFTLIETIVALAVLALLATVIASGLSSFREAAALNQAVDETLELLREARSKALASEGAVEYGVHFEATRVTLFRTGLFDPVDPANIAVVLPTAVTIVSINLSTTTGNVVFERLTGETFAAGAVTFTASRSGATRRIEVLPSGAVLKL